MQYQVLQNKQPVIMKLFCVLCFCQFLHRLCFLNSVQHLRFYKLLSRPVSYRIHYRLLYKFVLGFDPQVQLGLLFPFLPKREL